MSVRSNFFQAKFVLRHLRLLTGFVLCAFSPSLAFPEDDEAVRISVKEAVEEALKANLQLRSSHYSLEKRRIDRNASWFVFLPRLSLSAFWKDTKPSDSSASQTSLSANVSSLSINITEMLSTDVIAVLQAVEDYKGEKITFEKLTFDTAVKTQKVYFDLLIAREKLNLFKEQRTVSKVDSQEAQRAYKAGLKDENSMLQTKRVFLQAQQAYDAQINEEEKARRSLLFVMGREDMEGVISLTDDIPDVSQFNIQAILALASVDNAIASERISLRSLQLDRWKTAFQYLPSLSLDYSFLESTSLQDADNKNWFDSKNWKGGDNTSLTLTVLIDVTKYLPWSSTSVALRKLNVSIKAKNIDIKKLSIEKGNALKDKQSALKSLLKSLKDNETIMKIAERSYQLTQEGYKNGLVTAKEYLDAKAELHNEHIKRITQQAEAVKLILDIKALAYNSDGVYVR